MEDLEKRLQNRTSNLFKEEFIPEASESVAENADSTYDKLDYDLTRVALQQEGTAEILVEEKNIELQNKAATKRVQAETIRINEEAKKAEQEKRKQLAELDKTIAAKQKEVEELKTEGDKAQAFFDSNKEILEYIGVKSKKTLKLMYFLMVPASIIFMLVRALALPFTISGKLIEGVIDTVVGICNKISNNALKVIIAVVVIGVIIACGFLAYFYGGKLITNLK